jgi:probable rRNA maturation factor
MAKNIGINFPENFQLKKKEIETVIAILRKEFNFRIKALEINFIKRAELRNINISFLNHHYDTDIITFDYSDGGKLVDGEILISVDDAHENAKKFNVPVKNELVRLVIHGILHLMGYDDQTDSQRKTMFVKQEKLLRACFKNL